MKNIKYEHDKSTVFPNLTQAEPPSSLRRGHIYFVADTDSTSRIIDTGANMIIVNDSSLLKSITITSSTVKYIGGTAVIIITGTCQLSLPLKSDDGKLDHVSNLHAILVPSSP